MTNFEVVWFKKDLRIEDHLPLYEASKHGPVICIFIYEPSIYEEKPYTQSHRNFLSECLVDLDRQLHNHGGYLLVIKGEAPNVLNELRKKISFSRLWSHEETGDFKTYQRDLEVKDWCQSQGVVWHEMPQTGVVRRLKNRDGWSKNGIKECIKAHPLSHLP